MNASSDIDTSMALEKMAINPKIIHDDVNNSHLHFEKEIYQATEHLNEVITNFQIVMQKWFFLNGSSLPGDHMIDLQTSTKASQVINFCTSELTSLKSPNSSSKEPSFSSFQ